MAAAPTWVTYKTVLFKMYWETKDTHCSYLVENKIAHLLGVVLEGKYSSCSGRQEGIFPYLKAIFLPRGSNFWIVSHLFFSMWIKSSSRSYKLCHLSKPNSHCRIIQELGTHLLQNSATFLDMGLLFSRCLIFRAIKGTFISCNMQWSPI